MIDREVPASPPRRKDTTAGDGENHEDEERDVVNDTLLERTLRPRGLSDSSIHTTFMSRGGENLGTSGEHGGGRAASDEPGVAEKDGIRTSVFQALSRRVQSFRVASAAFASTAVAAAAAVPSRPHTPVNPLPPATSATATTALTTTSPDLPKTHLPSSPSSGLARSASPGALAASILPSLSSWAAAAAGTLEESPDLSSIPSSGPYSFLASPKDEGMLSRGWGRDREL